MDRSFKGSWCFLLVFLSLSFGISLKTAERKALENFEQLKIEMIELDKKHLEKLEHFGRFLPRADIEVSYTLSKKQSFAFNFPSFPPREFVFQRESYPKFTLQILQEIYNPSSIEEYEIKKITEKSYKYLVEEKKQQILYKVREAYVKALMAKAAVEIHEKNIQSIKAHLEDVKELYREGVVAYKDILETNVKLYEAREKLASAKADYKKALNYLSYLIGEKVNEVEELTDYKEISYEEIEQTFSRVEKKPLLLYLNQQITVAEKSIDLARSYFFPRLILSAFFQRTEESDLFPKDRYAVSLALHWNLFSGFRRFRSLEISRLIYRQAIERYKETRRRTLLELKTVLEDIKAVKVKIKLAEEQLKSAKEHLRIAKEKYKAGLGTNREILDAQSYLTTAERTLKMNRYELILKVFKLNKVVGYEAF